MNGRLGALAALLALAACAQDPEAPLIPPQYRDPAVTIASQANFDPVRYAGRWYEIARYPVPFQRGCVGTTADYSLRDDGRLGVVNTCREGALDGPVKRIAGEAEPVGPGRLKVRFDGVPLIAGDYWVLWVDESYRTAVVGTPGGRAGWILNRDPDIPSDRLKAAREVLDFNGYDLSRLRMVPQ